MLLPLCRGCSTRGFVTVSNNHSKCTFLVQERPLPSNLFLQSPCFWRPKFCPSQQRLNRPAEVLQKLPSPVSHIPRLILWMKDDPALQHVLQQGRTGSTLRYVKLSPRPCECVLSGIKRTQIRTAECHALIFIGGLQLWLRSRTLTPPPTSTQCRKRSQRRCSRGD